MIKNHMKTIIITSILTIAPMIVGIILWDKLPAEVPTHFGINNEPDGYSSKAFAVFGMPLLMLAMHIVCIFAPKLDPKNKNYNDKVFTMVLYIIPAVSLLIYLATVACSLFAGFGPHPHARVAGNDARLGDAPAHQEQQVRLHRLLRCKDGGCGDQPHERQVAHAHAYR